MITEQVKVCTKCKQAKSITEFNKHKSCKSGINTRCRVCVSENSKHWNKQNKEQRDKSSREAHLRKTYNMTLEQYDKLFKEQKGLCAICHTNKCPSGHTLAIDHDHKTNKIRGLLCVHCNSMLGRAKDNINILQSAIQYLRRLK